ncbi:DgyrCDS908 [Dimorphilus gyrociliatus]|uniref:GTP:AMP phosphotransferase, mitochondrial n=1 Tax=Dimorphilus gyrociliatus TaxID=2664684 RepID=A0A7I8V5W5_9ANNE|nr:DgyrCDS908 [Dimorphilus gyrociliatus]
MGAPGSGKGTISERIIKDFPMKHLSSGDLLRTNMKNKTDVGETAKRFIDNGHLVPDEIMTKLITNELSNFKNGSWLLDGFPRTVVQAKDLLKHTEIDIAIDLNVPFEVIIERIQGRLVHIGSGRVYHTEFNPPKQHGIDDVTGEPLIQRADDKPETVLARLKAYQNQTEPVLDYFREKKLLQVFTGRYSNELWPKVHKHLSTRIEPLQYTDYGTGK